MRTKLRWLLALGAIVALALTVVGVRRRRRAAQLERQQSASSQTPSSPPPTAAPDGAQEGGDADRDRGLATSTTSTPAPPTTSSRYMVTSATQRSLEAYAPDDVEEPTPLLADRGPDGLRGRQDDHLHDPRRRQVLAAGRPESRPRPTSSTRSSARCCPASPNGYVADLPGRRRAASTRRSRQAQDDPTGGAPDISGITAPDDNTLEIELTNTSSLGVIGALTLPVSSPVPEEYAKEFDAENPSTYGENQVATGPYMIENDAEGELTGYTPTRRSTWSATRTGRRRRRTSAPRTWTRSRSRRASPTRFGGARRSSRASARSTATSPPPPSVDQAGGDHGRGPGQLTLTPSGGNRYIALNTQRAPVRRHQRPQGRDRGRQPHGSAQHARR